MKRSMLKRNSVEENVDKVKKDASIEERERGGREERKEEMREIETRDKCKESVMRAKGGGEGCERGWR